MNQTIIPSVVRGPTGADVGRLAGRFIRCLGIARGDLEGARAFVAGQPWSDAPTLEAAFKSLMQPLTVGSFAGSAGPVFQDLALYLRPKTIIGRLPLRSIPFNTRVVRGIGGTRASWTVAGEPIPASYSSYDITDAVAVKKVSTIDVMSTELARNSSPRADMATIADVGAALAHQMNLAFIDPALGETEARPASVTNSAAVSRESSGATVAAVDSDLKAMIRDLVNAGMTLETATWILSPSTATSLSLMRGTDGALAYPHIGVLGGSMAGLPAITSAACEASGSPGENFIVLLEAGEVDLADDGAGDVEFTEHAAIQLDDTPIASAQPLTSLWQNGLFALKASRYANWRARRDVVASVLRSVAF